MRTTSVLPHRLQVMHIENIILIVDGCKATVIYKLVNVSHCIANCGHDNLLRLYPRKFLKRELGANLAEACFSILKFPVVPSRKTLSTISTEHFGLRISREPVGVMHFQIIMSCSRAVYQFLAHRSMLCWFSTILDRFSTIHASKFLQSTCTTCRTNLFLYHDKIQDNAFLESQLHRTLLSEYSIWMIYGIVDFVRLLLNVSNFSFTPILLPKLECS